jgi:hypothetical protein
MRDAKFWAIFGLAGAGFITLVYLMVESGTNPLTWLTTKFGAGSADPGGGAPATTFLGSVGNYFLEIGPSSESWETAVGTLAAEPLQAIESILGIGQNGDTGDTGSDDGEGGQ